VCVCLPLFDDIIIV